MINKERNNKLFEEYKRKSYKELDELEKNPNISYNDYVILSVARGIKEIEDGIEGIPAEEVFKELLGESYRENSIYANS
ncbi:MAG: hypothetical protein IJB90_04145 [Clostridia bacterium]|nr:hypothetical protein [Clostridia bacterium]